MPNGALPEQPPIEFAQLNESMPPSLAPRTVLPMSDAKQNPSTTGPDGGYDADQLLTLLYGELRRLAAQRLARETPGQTLDATALVHEVYVRLVGNGQAQHWNSPGHFFGAAAEAMRRILVERARHKASLKAGGDRQRQQLADIAIAAVGSGADLLSLNEALDKLEQQDRRKADLVKLRFFAGLTIEQAAEALGVSTSTADNDWAYARCWLRVAMEGTDT